MYCLITSWSRGGNGSLVAALIGFKGLGLGSNGVLVVSGVVSIGVIALGSPSTRLLAGLICSASACSCSAPFEAMVRSQIGSLNPASTIKHKPSNTPRESKICPDPNFMNAKLQEICTFWPTRVCSS